MVHPLLGHKLGAGRVAHAGGVDMSDQEKVQLVAAALFTDRETMNSCAVAPAKRAKKALKALLRALLGREPTDQEIQDAENL